MSADFGGMKKRAVELYFRSHGLTVRVDHVHQNGIAWFISSQDAQDFVHSQLDSKDYRIVREATP